jgi:hypothetical protein
MDVEQTKTYGSNTSLWGLTLTPADINASTFGLAFSAKSGNTTRAYIDYVAIKVYYTTVLRAGIQSVSSTVYYSTQDISFYTASGGLLIGDSGDDKIYSASSTVYTDNTESIRTLRRTGHIQHDTLKNKRANKMKFRVKVGVENASEPSPTFLLRWKNDNKEFNTGKTISLKTQANNIIHLHRLGIYQTRQYEIIHDDASEFILVEAEEEVEVLR